jgi:hypothetical protein
VDSGTSRVLKEGIFSEAGKLTLLVGRRDEVMRTLLHV